MKDWHYIGDVNVIEGGCFIDLSTWEDEYCDCVRVSEIQTVTIIEHITINILKDRWKDSLRCCGLTVANLLAMGSDERKICLAESVMYYGYYDHDDAWDGYTSSYMERIATEDTEQEEVIKLGWILDKTVHADNLRGYIEAKHLT